MTQENKELLLKDLCARLTYETRVRYTYAFAGAACINEYSDEGTLSYDKLQNFSLPNVGYERRRVVCILPYLRSISSMTEEESNQLEDITNGWLFHNTYHDCETIYPIGQFTDDDQFDNILKGISYLNERHFDYRGLIPLGLALEAPEGMYKTE